MLLRNHHSVSRSEISHIHAAYAFHIAFNQACIGIACFVKLFISGIELYIGKVYGSVLRFTPGSQTIGETKTKLYISFGVSGAVNHTAGVDAEVFVAVDKNPNAQIFNYCDYGIVGDMDEVCDEMIDQLKARKS